MTRGLLRYKTARSQQGFTLIELAIVVILISLFSAISIPLLTRSDRGELNAAARRMAGAVKYLYNETALSGKEHRLLWNLDNNSYAARILEDDGELEELDDAKSQRQLPTGISFADIVIPGRGSYNQGEVAIRIYPSGWLEETIIHLRNRSGDELTMHINPLTGSSEVFNGYRTFEQ